jgi:Dual specificity phosphatase, catalytic domain
MQSEPCGADAPNLSWLTEDLSVGAAPTVGLIPRLRMDYGIGHVVDVRSEAQHDAAMLREHGLELLQLPTLDHHAISEDMLQTGTRWALDRLERGGRVYIHCQHGIGRSVLLSWCVLVALGQAPRDALMQIKAARVCASPSPAQIHALLHFARRYTSELPSWDELADIAYAHLRLPA